MKIAWKVTCLIVLLRCRTPFTPHPVKGCSSAPHTLSHAWLALFLWFSLFIHISEGCALQNGWHFGKVSSSLWSLLWISEDTLTFGRFGIILIMKLFRNIYSCDLTCLSVSFIHHYPSIIILPSHPTHLTWEGSSALAWRHFFVLKLKCKKSQKSTKMQNPQTDVQKCKILKLQWWKTNCSSIGKLLCTQNMGPVCMRSASKWLYRNQISFTINHGVDIVLGI